MRALIATLLLSLVTSAGAIGLDWGNPSTNNYMLSWYKYTNGPVLRYTAYWTPLVNSDTGTNWATTTNWTMFADAGSSVTNAPLLYWTRPPTNSFGAIVQQAVPTNSLVTIIITVPGGARCPPFMVLTNGGTGLMFSNQPAYPIPK